MGRRKTVGKNQDNIFVGANIKIEDNVMKYGREAIQVSNISQIRVSKEPPYAYSIGSILGLCICAMGFFLFPVMIAVWVIGMVIFGFKILGTMFKNSDLKTYLIIEMNSGRVSMFSAKDEQFFVEAKDALVKCFNQKGLSMTVNFSDCVVNGNSFGNNNSTTNNGV